MFSYNIVIPTYNSAATLERLLESLQNQTRRDFDVTVVDDASQDNTPDVAQKYAVRYERLKTRKGPANARNIGAALTESTWLIFADADTEFEPDTIEKIDHMLTVSSADALVGSYAGTPANDGFAPRYKALWERCIIDEGIRKNELGYQKINFWTPRPGVVRRGAFEKIGGFDTGFSGADLEDVDLGHRLSDAGYVIAFAPGVHIRHNYPKNVKTELKAFARRSAIWMRMFRSRKKFDSTGESSPRQAVAHMLGFGSFVLIPAVAIDTRAALPLFVIFFGFWLLNSPFVRAAFRQESPATALAFMLYCWLHSIVLGFSAIYGLLTPAREAAQNES